MQTGNLHRQQVMASGDARAALHDCAFRIDIFQQAEKLAAAQALASRLEGITVQITRKAGEDGRLFGSVTNIDIAEGLQQLGYDIPRAQILMPQGPIKSVGETELEIALHTDVRVTIKVSVLGEH